jgi:cell division protein FtsQ
MEHKGNQQRRRNRTRAVVTGFFLFIGVVAVLESPLTRVRSLTVSGNTSISEQDIIKSAQLSPGMSLWQVNGAAVQHRVTRAEPLIQSVSVHTDYMTGVVTLQVHEKHVVALYEDGGQFYELLQDGTVLGKTSSAAGFPWPIVTAAASGSVVAGQKAPNSDIPMLCEQLSRMPASFLTTVSEIQLDAFGNATLYFDNGFAARSQVQSLVKNIPTIDTAVQYFSSKGYQPGLVDVSGGPPYEYTPFHDEGSSG